MKTTRALSLALLPVTLLAVACGTSEPAADDNDKPAEGQEITLTGSDDTAVTLPAPATDVVALEWMQVESLVALGVDPVGVADVDGYNTWVPAAPIDADTPDVGSRNEPSPQSIARLSPDLVIADASSPESVIKKLRDQEIPVLVLSTSDASDQLGTMREAFTSIATAVGKAEEGEQVLADLDEEIADAAQELEEDGMKGAKFAIADGWQDGGNIAVRLFAKGSLMSDLAEAVGMVNAWPGKGDPEWGLQTTDPEGLTQLPADVQFLYNSPDGEDDVFTGALTDNPIWQGLGFVKAGDVHRLSTGVWTFGAPLSAEAFLDVLTDLYDK